jgi:hypothetical protein
LITQWSPTQRALTALREPSWKLSCALPPPNVDLYDQIANTWRLRSIRTGCEQTLRPQSTSRGTAAATVKRPPTRLAASAPRHDGDGSKTEL